MNKKPNVGFICVHNSCRSQMAEAIAKIKYKDIFNAYSAGSEVSRDINVDAIRLIKDRYDFDMSKSQKPKLISNLPDLEVVITMGCDVVCPVVEGQIQEDWDLIDPTNQPDDVYIEVIETIEANLEKLVLRLQN